MGIEIVSVAYDVPYETIGWCSVRLGAASSPASTAGQRLSTVAGGDRAVGEPTREAPEATSRPTAADGLAQSP